MKGQALVEFSIVLAITLPLLLAATQIAMLLTYQFVQSQSTATIAVVAARSGPGAEFDAVVASESTRIGCEAPTAVISEPEPGVIVVDLGCTWHAPVFADATWPVSTSASAPRPPEPAAAASIEEDDPGWDCTTMGNLVCGTVAP